jgi:hypothetical protein
MEGAPPAESDLLSFKAKLITKLVTERKRVYYLDQDLVKKLLDNAAHLSKFQSTYHIP